MKVFHVFIVCAVASIACSQERVPSKTGNIVVHEAFESKVLGNTRTVTVYLPPDYATNARRKYPVLYMGDGQNVFDGMTSYIPNKEWRLDETAQSLIEAKEIEPVIIVGIDNAGAARADEYLPTRAKFGGNEGGGKADLFVTMIVDELKTFIDKTYRTKRDAKNTGIGGSSFGGVMALHAAITRPDVFGKASVVSPSVWWDERVMIKRIKALPNAPKVKVWLDTGTAEGSKEDKVVQNLIDLFDAMLEKGWTLGDDLSLEITDGAQHNETAWAARAPLMLKFLFPHK